MVLPGTFMPFFFPLGIAFMGSQSAVMMKMAGEQWQYGKRRISAMTNEEFNKLTPLKLFEIETSELRSMIPLMQESMRDMNKLTPIIVTEMVQMFKDLVNGLFQALQSETDKNLHPLFNWMLALMGFPAQNIGPSQDFDNTPDKFQPPPKVIPFKQPPPPQEFITVTPEIVKKETPEEFQEQATLLANIVFFRRMTVKQYNERFGKNIVNDTNGRKFIFKVKKGLLTDAIKKYKNWQKLQRNR